VPLIGPTDVATPTVSVIVPLHEDSARFRGCLNVELSLPTKIPYEVVVVTDEGRIDLPAATTHVTTGLAGPTSPAVKRDAGGKEARGEILAFIDDDAYPRADWLDAALRVLSDRSVHGVGGPGLTPPESGWRERLGGAVYESRLGSGPLRHRFVPGKGRDEDDLPAYNLILKRDALERIGGWNSTFYGGEDTKVCLELVKAGFQLRHDPDVVVFHHRRPVFLPHFRQVGNVGLHRGYFVRRYPSTSRRLSFFAPAVATSLGVPIAAVLLRRWLRSPRARLLAGLATWLALSAPVMRQLGPSAILFPAALAGHHLAYGANFLRGMLARRVDR
jgi:hypothetical protein